MVNIQLFIPERKKDKKIRDWNVSSTSDSASEEGDGYDRPRGEWIEVQPIRRNIPADVDANVEHPKAHCKWYDRPHAPFSVAMLNKAAAVSTEHAISRNAAEFYQSNRDWVKRRDRNVEDLRLALQKEREMKEQEELAASLAHRRNTKQKSDAVRRKEDMFSRMLRMETARKARLEAIKVENHRKLTTPLDSRRRFSASLVHVPSSLTSIRSPTLSTGERLYAQARDKQMKVTNRQQQQQVEKKDATAISRRLDSQRMAHFEAMYRRAQEFKKRREAREKEYLCKLEADAVRGCAPLPTSLHILREKLTRYALECIDGGKKEQKQSMKTPAMTYKELCLFCVYLYPDCGVSALELANTIWKRSETLRLEGNDPVLLPAQSLPPPPLPPSDVVPLSLPPLPPSPPFHFVSSRLSLSIDGMQISRSLPKPPPTLQDQQRWEVEEDDDENDEENDQEGEEENEKRGKEVASFAAPLSPGRLTQQQLKSLLQASGKQQWANEGEEEEKGQDADSSSEGENEGEEEEAGREDEPMVPVPAIVNLLMMNDDVKVGMLYHDAEARKIRLADRVQAFTNQCQQTAVWKADTKAEVWLRSRDRQHVRRVWNVLRRATALKEGENKERVLDKEAWHRAVLAMMITAGVGQNKSCQDDCSKIADATYPLLCGGEGGKATYDNFKALLKSRAKGASAAVDAEKKGTLMILTSTVTSLIGRSSLRRLEEAISKLVQEEEEEQKRQQQEEAKKAVIAERPTAEQQNATYLGLVEYQQAMLKSLEEEAHLQAQAKIGAELAPCTFKPTVNDLPETLSSSPDICPARTLLSTQEHVQRLHEAHKKQQQKALQQREAARGKTYATTRQAFLEQGCQPFRFWTDSRIMAKRCHQRNPSPTPPLPNAKPTKAAAQALPLPLATSPPSPKASPANTAAQAAAKAKPVTSNNSNSSNQSLLNLEALVRVTMGPDKTLHIKVKAGDDPTIVAHSFGQAHSLAPERVAILEDYLKTHIQILDERLLVVAERPKESKRQA